MHQGKWLGQWSLCHVVALLSLVGNSKVILDSLSNYFLGTEWVFRCWLRVYLCSNGVQIQARISRCRLLISVTDSELPSVPPVAIPHFMAQDNTHRCTRMWASAALLLSFHLGGHHHSVYQIWNYHLGPKYEIWGIWIHTDSNWVPESQSSYGTNFLSQSNNAKDARSKIFRAESRLTGSGAEAFFLNP